MHCVRRYCKVEPVGPPELIFTEEERRGTQENNAPIDIPYPELALRIDQLGRSATDNDLAELGAMGVQVDDDNLPAPENIPTRADNNNSIFEEEWGHCGVCPRRLEGGRETKAKIEFSRHVAPTRLQLFELLFPKEYILEVILPETNKSLQGKDVSYGEFLRFLGIWFLMATLQGFQRRDFWSSKTITVYDGAPYRFGSFMSRIRFEDILRNLKYTNEVPPAY